MTGREKWKHQKNKHALMRNDELEGLYMKRLFELGNQYVREDNCSKEKFGEIHHD